MNSAECSQKIIGLVELITLFEFGVWMGGEGTNAVAVATAVSKRVVRFISFFDVN
jgi:hypothetical protein